ncbi:MAG: pyruvate:ferredoxin (flavodoxin) oxidoreductase [Lachnospiraceae bacterium]|nr:pyruvate:ferredoxin (flavodoxin) oxidoreductase [Lachnospiraceae bacterium]
MASKQIMDGCTAATHIAYALSDVATIYPITPVAEMGQVAQLWGMNGRKNYMGATMAVKEMESELGAAGATHGALAAGSLATTFTNSQGLLLMIPNMYKISGELLPGVFHVGTRSLAAHALSIFGDHQDIMACRATGFAFLGSSSVQETMDLALVAHLAAIEGSVPVVHFFDGWRTSGEMATIDVIDYDTIFSLIDRDKIDAFRRRGLNPCHPVLRGSAQNPDVYFQNREAANKYYTAFPDIVQKVMDRVSEKTGRSYNIFDYHGAPDADRVIVIMGSGAQVVKGTVDYLNALGEKTGVVNVRLFRPWSAQRFIAALPSSVKTIAVLDATKEPGSQGEPLYQDVAMSILNSGLTARVIGGRYGLSSKDFTPAMVKAVFDEAAKESPKQQFTVGINDDVTRLSLGIDPAFTIEPKDTTQCIFYGMGSDGTVGATKQIASIIGNRPDWYAQAYFHYSAKKSGGYTLSQLRFSHSPVTSEYSIDRADYLACNKDTYVNTFHVTDKIKTGGTFVLNSSWTIDDMDRIFPARLKKSIAGKKLKFYNIDATKIAAEENLGVRINTIMEAVFFHLTGIIDINEALTLLKAEVKKSYMHEGGDVVNRNIAAIDRAIQSIEEINYPESWINATDISKPDTANLPEFVKNIAKPCMELQGDTLPVSMFSPDGSMPMGTTAYEKRRIAINVPQWEVDKCIQCTLCSLVCPHAAIRPYLLDAGEAKAAPEGMSMKPASGNALQGLQYRIQVYTEDCTGCGSCATICPGHALTMMPLESQLNPQIRYLEYLQNNVTIKENLLPRFTVKGSQLRRPLLQFSGACGGCGETPYIKLLTQLSGKHSIIANATGCSSIWGANFPSNAYCTDSDGKGPAWGNSLFEDNAEYGYGMAVAVRQRRERALEMAKAIVADTSSDPDAKTVAQAWIEAFDDFEKSETTGMALAEKIEAFAPFADVLGKKSVWAIGGDGWAYDIGFAGLDHVLASGEDINILVMDTECYSNTGGQTSKATPLGAVTKYSPDGKRTVRKDLGRMMMTYPYVYVASIALGANYQQAIDAMKEAEAYPGPSIIIAYCPCINHGIRSGMSHSIVEERNAVECGYWQIYRYNPSLADPMSLDCATPVQEAFLPFINGEDRYADLKMIDPAEAAKLQPALQQRCSVVHNILSKI